MGDSGAAADRLCAASSKRRSRAPAPIAAVVTKAVPFMDFAAACTRNVTASAAAIAAAARSRASHSCASAGR